VEILGRFRLLLVASTERVVVKGVKGEQGLFWRIWNWRGSELMAREASFW